MAVAQSISDKLRAQDERILILTPTGRDAELTQQVIRDNGMDGLACETMEELCHRIQEGCGAILLADEVTVNRDSRRLVTVLTHQPRWSDLPLVVLSSPPSQTTNRGWQTVEEALGPVSNATILERPIRRVALLNALRVALKARRRQYEIRDHLVERKRQENALRESEHRFRGTFENAAVGIAHIGVDGTWLRVNNKLCEIMGYARQDLLTMKVQETSPLDLEIFAPLASGETTSHSIEVGYTRQTGQDACLQLTVSLQRDVAGNPLYYIAVAEDITNRKEAERKLRELNETLEQRVQERTASMVTYQQKLRELTSELTLTEQRERRRLATELHDYLCQLLVACKMKRGQIEKVIEKARTSEEADLSKAERQLNEMDDMLDESIKYTRTLIAELSPTILYESGLRPAMNWLADKLKMYDLALQVRETGEPRRLTDDQAILTFQATRELLLNVVKHAQVNEATVTLAWEPRRLSITVRDEGVGFDQSTPKDFNSTQGQFGLFNVRERIEAFGGTVTLESEPNKGTTSQLIVPLERAPEQHRPPPERRLLTPAGTTADMENTDAIRVVLVDDHDMVRDGLRSIIDVHSDFLVVGEAASGEEAIDLARALVPDVMVMDVNMPLMNGIDATRRIKQELPHIRIIGLSIHEDGGIAATMKEAGADAYMTKGGPSRELCEAIRVQYRAATAVDATDS